MDHPVDLTEVEARERLDAGGESFVFFADPATSEVQVRRQIPVLEGVE